ncbi:EAL domain-containing protein [Candidatus Finniella inopinata]|uniref:EAL domain-containing protein n=1 Tax=Candidatus Finniella inopinata TaxID=1696036 RepID=A0A4Q7DKY3_9PROT|nr:EAL domain-containing protein [Candidatus Finniella inopinata]RZI46885.1 EAL domain-containing protein [Candidatus Finniella inopinata]
MAIPLNQDAQLAEFLAKAIDHDQLRLFIQPQTSMTTGQVVGGEVLLRMPTSINDLPFASLMEGVNFSSIPIYQWIQTALNQGLIHSLSEWIVKNVIKQLEQKSHMVRCSVPLSVNMPPEMIDKNFVVFLEKCFTKHTSVDPSQLSIEITEFPKADNLEVLNRNIQQLRAMGMRVILDDFGSGYATMNYLVELAVDAVKIDQSFIQKAPHSPSARAVLKCLIDLAKEIDLEVVCEGVETLEQLMIVQSMRCDVIQGFLISEPVPFNQFWTDLEKGTKPVLH